MLVSQFSCMRAQYSICSRPTQISKYARVEIGVRQDSAGAERRLACADPSSAPSTTKGPALASRPADRAGGQSVSTPQGTRARRHATASTGRRADCGPLASLCSTARRHECVSSCALEGECARRPDGPRGARDAMPHEVIRTQTAATLEHSTRSDTSTQRM